MSHRASSRAGVNSARLSQREGSGMWDNGRALVWLVERSTYIHALTERGERERETQEE